MPAVAMMIGVPLSGKTTCLETYPFSFFLGKENDVLRTIVASSDDYIEKIAKAIDMTYSDIFTSVIKLSTKAMYRDIDNAIDANFNVIWDQTNLDRESRKKKLNRFPDEYEKIAVYFEPPSVEKFKIRNENRRNNVGKNIPLDVFNDMVKRLEIPSIDEGFNRIIQVF